MDHSKLRPISLLPVIPKIFEKNVHDQTICYLVNMTFYKNISPVFELNIQTNLCFLYLNYKILKGFGNGPFNCYDTDRSSRGI